MKYVIWYSLNCSSNVSRSYYLREYFSTYKEAENRLEKAIKRIANEGLIDIGITDEYGEIHNFEGVSCGIMPVKDGFLTKISRRWAKSFN